MRGRHPARGPGAHLRALLQGRSLPRAGPWAAQASACPSRATSPRPTGIHPGGERGGPGSTFFVSLPASEVPLSPSVEARPRSRAAPPVMAAERAAPYMQRSSDLDGREGALAHHLTGRADELRQQLREVGVVAHDHGLPGFCLPEHFVETAKVTAARQPFVHHGRQPEGLCPGSPRSGWRARGGWSRSGRAARGRRPGTHRGAWPASAPSG